MNTTIAAMLRLTTAIAETHDNPTPLFKLWKAISESNNRDLTVAAHKMVGKTVVDAIMNNKDRVDAALQVEPYDLDESTLLDQIIADLGDPK